jgi:hypothetical protein
MPKSPARNCPSTNELPVSSAIKVDHGFSRWSLLENVAVFRRKGQMTSSSNETTGQHILLTGLGVSRLGEKPRNVTYGLGTRIVTAQLAPLALLKLLDASNRPVQVLAMVTEGAREITWPLFRSGVEQTLGFAPTPIDIPDGRNAHEIREIVEAVAARISEGAELTLDVTQGFRHFPFLLYAISVYLQSLRGIRIRGAYYGMLEGTAEGEVKPIINLQPLLELPEWFYAARVFNEAGATSAIARLTRHFAAQLREQAAGQGNDPVQHQGASHVEQIAKGLDQVGFASAAGLPLELGKASTMLLATQRHIPDSLASSLPLGREIWQRLAATIEPFCFPAPPSWGGKWKRKVDLNGPELDRQAVLIDRLFEHNHLPAAIGLLEEWVVSWVILHQFREDEKSEWLNFREVRRKASQSLGALAAYTSREGRDASEEQRAWGIFWNQLTDLRNAVHHHGMREESWESRPQTLVEVLNFWQRVRSGASPFPEFGGGGGRLLISPQGSRPGVLYSALKATESNRCLVVCSPQSSASVEEAADRATFTGKIDKLVVRDAFSGFGEISDLLKTARTALLQADKITANVTGGTTLMGIIVQRLVEEAQKLDRPVRRFALIDRRPPAAQESEPYIASESHWLDAKNIGDADGHD